MVIIGLLQSWSISVLANTIEKHGRCSKKGTWDLKLSRMGSSTIKTYFHVDIPSYVGQTWKIVAYNGNNKKIFEDSVSTDDNKRRLRSKHKSNNNNNDNDDDVETANDQGEYFSVWFTRSNLREKDTISIRATASKSKEVCKANVSYSW
jgi:hypothetical protein